MAHSKETKTQLRELYVFGGASLRQAADKLGVPFHTARKWRQVAQHTDEDWDCARALNYKIHSVDVAQSVYAGLMVAIDETVGQLTQLSLPDRVKSLTSLSDALSKTHQLGERLMPEINRQEMVMQIVRLIGDKVQQQHPELMSAFTQVLDEISPQLERL